mmetsp:Transcript_35014/g.35653  ORF Transcript_35014/g.35653 Transcript_35014/m.35653 type:complete len:124 (+) Transcript_35014:172-543(+)
MASYQPEESDFEYADIPDKFKDARACLRCSLIKTFQQFYDTGCENCPFLQMEGNNNKIQSCTTAFFEGTIALLDPEGSWVAKWQRIAKNIPGLYAVEVAGVLPDDMLGVCEDHGLPPRSSKPL